MKIFTITLILGVCIFLIPGSASAYWVWTPETGKWVNPKYAVKDTPEEQFDLAIGFYKNKDYKRAVNEFHKLLKYYPKSELAPTSQYYVGRVYEDTGEYYQSYQAYQKTIDTYPFTEKVDEIVEHQYKIGNLFLSGYKEKVLGVAILPVLDKAAEIFGKVVENAPYGKYAPLAQFKMGEVYKKSGNFEEAILEFQRLVDKYPDSELADDAKYEIAYCTYKFSLEPHYDQTPTDVAIKQFEEFKKEGKDEALGKEAQDALKRLREKKAESLYETAFFYERQKHYESASIYYNEVLENFADTGPAVKALSRLKILEKKEKASKPRGN